MSISEITTKDFLAKVAILRAIGRNDRNPLEMEISCKDGNRIGYVLYMGLPPRAFFKNVEKYYRHSNVSVGEMLVERSTNLEVRQQLIDLLTEMLSEHCLELDYIRTAYAKGLDALLNTTCRDFYDNMDDWYGVIRGTAIFSSKMKDCVEEIINTSTGKLLDFGRPKCSYCDRDMIKLTISHYLKPDKTLDYLHEINHDFENLVFTKEMEERYLGEDSPVDRDIRKLRKWFPNHHLVLNFEVTNTPITMACKMINSPLKDKLEFIRLAMQQVL